MTEQNLTAMEEQLAQLQEAIAVQRRAEGVQIEGPVQRAEVHEQIGKIRAQVEGAAAAPVSESAIATDGVPEVLQQQLQDLVTVAFTKGAAEAVSQARSTNNSALVDALHDMLADKFHALLVERHKLSEAP